MAIAANYYEGRTNRNNFTHQNWSITSFYRLTIASHIICQNMSLKCSKKHQQHKHKLPEVRPSRPCAGPATSPVTALWQSLESLKWPFKELQLNAGFIFCVLWNLLLCYLCINKPCVTHYVHFRVCMQFRAALILSKKRRSFEMFCLGVARRFTIPVFSFENGLHYPQVSLKMNYKTHTRLRSSKMNLLHHSAAYLKVTH